MNRLHRRTYAEIDLRRLEANFHKLRGLLPEGEFFCPMVKANAYGHGDIEVARTLELAGTEWLGVCLVEEGVRLRDAGIRTRVLVFGVVEEYSLEVVLKNHLTPVISDWAGLDAVARLAREPVSVHIKFNTGMNRLGFGVQDAPKVRAWFDQHPDVRLEGIATHLYHGEDAGIPGGESEAQLLAYEEALRAFRGLTFHRHVLNSSGYLNLQARIQAARPLAKGTAWPYGARVGIALYGAQPVTPDMSTIVLEPVLSFRSHIVSLHRLKSGDKVSYNATWTAGRPSLVGIVPVGYGDGFQRQFSNQGEVLCRGRRAPVVGTVCMDYFMVDFTDIEAQTGVIAPGEEIVMIGEQDGVSLTATDLANRAVTISYEIFTRISERVPRRFIR